MLRVCVGVEIDLVHGRLDLGNLEELSQLLEVEVADTNAPTNRVRMLDPLNHLVGYYKIVYLVSPSSLSFSNSRHADSKLLGIMKGECIRYRSTSFSPSYIQEANDEAVSLRP